MIFLIVNSFAASIPRNNASGGVANDDNDGDGVTGEIFSADSIQLAQNGIYDFSAFLTDVTNSGGNDNAFSFRKFYDTLFGER